MNKEKKMLDRIVGMVYTILSVDTTQIKTDIPIQDLGFTSVELVKLVDKLSSALNDEIHPGIFFEHDTLEKLNTYLFANKTETTEAYLARMENPDSSSPLPLEVNNTKENTINETDWMSLEVDSLFEDPNTAPPKTQVKEMAQGNLPQQVPVIIGGGIAGMLISRKLSRKKIAHIIIGKPMLEDSPRLGESMTELVSIEFTKEFKDYAQYFYAKEVTPFYMGDRVSGLRFDYFRTLQAVFSDDKDEQTNSFIHVDRIGFDRALYDEVSRSKECYWIQDMVTDIEFNEKTDQVNGIHLKDHATIVPSFVWDCTNHVRLLGNKMNIPFKNFDEQRRVFFTHYSKKNSGTSCNADNVPWIHATTLLQAQGNTDGLKGISWLIPLGDYISVGISMNPMDIGDKTAEEIMALLSKAYQNRGLDYTEYFPRRKEIVSIPSQHYAYDRLVGKNWALVGGSGINAWFTSGSNLSIVTCMAAMADKIIAQPEIYGEHYTNHTQGFVQTQKVYDALLDSDLGAVDAMKFLSGIIEQSRRRIASYFMFKKGLGSETAKLGNSLWEEDVLIDKAYFDFLKQIATHATPVNRKEQTAEIFEKFSEMAIQNRKVTLPYLKGNEVRNEKQSLFLDSSKTVQL